MLQYSIDHQGNYPDGPSSTAVFQGLIDGGYVDDPTIFYFPRPGKIKPTTRKLKPENVCFDVTAPLDQHAPDALPLVFCTGYRLEYKDGGCAFILPTTAATGAESQKLAVSYINLTTRSFGKTPADPVVIPPDAKLGPGPWRQLTPEGVLGAGKVEAR